MSIPYRDEQILRILASNPAGLTTGQILAIAKTQRANELPDSNITSQRIYALRETKTPKIQSIDTADSGRIHKITAAGRAVLAELGPSIHDVTPTAETKPDPTTDPAATDEPVDILQQFDQAVEIIRESLIEAINAPSEPIRITDKQKKIELLEKLENTPLLETRVIQLINDIRRDIEQLDEV
jgi:hypothetical protein